MKSQQTVITNSGLSKIREEMSDGKASYWLGYYGLAYVPEEYRESQDGQPPKDAISASMTQLTKYGDVIYNVIQGAMKPEGYQTDIGTSAAEHIYNECMYTGSVISKYRYVLDENGNNKLLVFESVNEAGQPVGKNDAPYGLQVYQEYRGISPISESECTESELDVIPAPLYYRGEPVAWDADVRITDKVTSDTRIINASSTWSEQAATRDHYAWNQSQDFTYSDEVPGEFKIFSDLEHVQSISNFNRFHAPANADGYAVDAEPATRNVAKATKLFPVGHYEVQNTIDSNHVGNVKYTINIDLNGLLQEISTRSTTYFVDGKKLDPITDKETLDSYKTGFKFNRIGLYAVSVSMHHLQDQYAKDSCKDGIQMQINGNDEPVLFAVVDMPTPIELSAGNGSANQYKCDIQVNLAAVGGGIVDMSSIYYNLYENDAIKWYKNQLIANASAAEAVTTLGVQLNYLRQQVADMSSNTAICGIAEDSSYYSNVSNNGGLKNLVDSNYGAGAVRGINTILEAAQSIVVNKRNGDELVNDIGNTGNYSLGIGLDSSTMGQYSINLSKNGVVGPSAEKIFMLGGKNRLDMDDAVGDICINDSAYSIVFAGDKAKLEKMHSSLWMVSDYADAHTYRDVYVEQPVIESSGIGAVSVLAYDEDAVPLFPVSLDNKVVNSSLYGHMNIYTTVDQSMLMLDDIRGARTSVGKLDLLSSMSTDLALRAQTDYTIHASDVFDYAGLSSGLAGVMTSGRSNTIGRNVNHSLGLLSDSAIANNTTNVLMIGQHINDARPTAVACKIFTVQQFNDAYANSFVADDDTFFTQDINHNAIVVGDGEIYGKNNDVGHTTFSHNSKGVTLYIRYDTTTQQWRVPNPRKATFDAYQKPGHDIKNMLMIGDYNSVGYESSNSIILGDNAAFHSIAYKNSFITNAGSDVPSTIVDELNVPRTVFNNVWWIGHTYSVNDDSVSGYPCGDNWLNKGHFLASHLSDEYNAELSDMFAFVGRNNKQFSFASWYGINNLVYGGNTLLPLLDNHGITYDQLYQPCKSPMIYSGGIALGGYGTPESDFMLMKIGTRGCWYDDSNSGSTGGEHHPNMWVPNLRDVKQIVHLKYDQPDQSQEPTIVNQDGNITLYDNLCSDGIHHLQVASPYAGMALVVQEKQELDGTLHVGLGRVGGGLSTQGMRTVKILASYIRESTVAFNIEITTLTQRQTESMEVQIPIPPAESREHDYTPADPQPRRLTSRDGTVAINVFCYFRDSADKHTAIVCSLHLDPHDSPMNTILQFHSNMDNSGIDCVAPESLVENPDGGPHIIYVEGMNQPNQLMMLTIDSSWKFYNQNTNGDYYHFRYPSLGTKDNHPYNVNTVSLGVIRGQYNVYRNVTKALTFGMIPVEIPGYYADYDYTGIMKTDSHYYDAQPFRDGELPYTCWDMSYSYYVRGT